ncbi:glycosyltransferase involved in cell wall biosynthesis [Halanaerobium saccharolyticum]|uniref:Glycosyltransferase involved in cell wall biosynthesis n=1 Tax=Halanaerobium saccharolyticum TaxID=43595 RepID=A0A4R6LYY0_9FIRM|nr:glycosyltransferase family 4 protein [Halanaerobium saccharolyticum]TDO94097.1 glycosyltransferase involved in cell wall biosynthesis [Halanaerobium saccharolyticum]
MKILVLSSHTKSLFWFRLDMMKSFIKNGHEVVAVGSESMNEWKDKFKEHNIKYLSINVDRNGTNPLKDLKTLIELFKIIKNEKPEKIFSYQAKTVIYGSIAARIYGVKDIYSLIAGLGSIFRGKGLKNRLIKTIMKFEYKLASKFNKKLFFQNNDDRNLFIKEGIVDKENTVIINGSGVNTNEFKSKPFPEVNAFLFIGRLIKDKGIIEYLEAAKKVKESYPNTRFLLVGPFDSNPSALRSEDLDPYISNDIIEYFGYQEDVRPYIEQSSVFVLPSYHEGTPKTVLEAMAMGRPIITTDAPGCRETVDNGENGFLVKLKDADDLAEKMITLINDPKLQKQMGKKSLQIVKEKYDVEIVNKSIMEAMEL